MNIFVTIITIGIGATIGASIRHYLTIAMTYFFGKELFYGTLSANVLGSFLAGIFVVVILEKAVLSEAYRLLLLVGLAGSLTTMSALSVESMQMLSLGNYKQAGLNIIVNVVLSLLFVWLGLALARYLFVDS